MVKPDQSPATLDAQRRHDLLEIEQPGPGLAVGVHQSVGDEVAVVNFLTEVAAVGELLAAVRAWGR